MTPQAMGELVDELEQLGYVEHRPDPSDRRAKLIMLTDKGRACIAAGLTTIEGFEERITTSLGERGHRQLRARHLRLRAHDVRFCTGPSYADRLAVLALLFEESGAPRSLPDATVVVARSCRFGQYR